jgi:hypothetical protein
MLFLLDVFIPQRTNRVVFINVVCESLSLFGAISFESVHVLYFAIDLLPLCRMFLARYIGPFSDAYAPLVLSEDSDCDQNVQRIIHSSFDIFDFFSSLATIE